MNWVTLPVLVSLALLSGCSKQSQAKPDLPVTVTCKHRLIDGQPYYSVFFHNSSDKPLDVTAEFEGQNNSDAFPVQIEMKPLSGVIINWQKLPGDKIMIRHPNCKAAEFKIP